MRSIQLEFDFMNDPKNKNNDMQDVEGEIHAEGDFGNSDEETPLALPDRKIIDDKNDEDDETNYF